MSTKDRPLRGLSNADIDHLLNRVFSTNLLADNDPFYQLAAFGRVDSHWLPYHYTEYLDFLVHREEKKQGCYGKAERNSAEITRT